MSELREFDAGSVVIERAAEGDGRTVSGYAYRWGEASITGTPQTAGLREAFDRGAFTAAIAERGARPWPFLDGHGSKGGKPVGSIRFAEDEIGLRYEGRLLDTERAREYAAGVETGADGVSLEMILSSDKSYRKGDAIIHRSVRPIALAGVTQGAYASATVAIREVQQMEPEVEVTAPEVPGVVATAGPIPLTREQTIEVATRAAEEISRTFAERAAIAGAKPQPLSEYRNLGELMQATYRGEAPRDHISLALEIAERALADTVTTAGANAALLTGNLTVREIVGIISRGRPAITAFGGPAPIQDTGLTVTWPYFDGTLTDYVAAQSAQKAEIESAAVDIKLGTEALVTYAGGTDIAYQLMRQGDPSILDAVGRIILTAWGVVTDAAFVTELETGTVTDDSGALGSETFATLLADVIDQSIIVETATGQPAEFVLASSTSFAAYAKLIAAASTQVVLAGDLDLRSMRLTIGGIPLIHVPSLTAGKSIISNTLAAKWHEAGPFLATAEDVAKLGRNVAYWSMGAGARYIPAGIVEHYDVP